MLKTFKRQLAAAMLALAAWQAPVAHAVPVDLELVLLTDVSGSVDATDFNLMRNGYVSAFQSASLQNAIEAGTLGRIAVTLVYFSASAVQSIGWTLIDTAIDANNFAALINSTLRPTTIGNGTGLTQGLNLSAGLFAGNGFEGTRRVIDVVGDGAESEQCTFSAPSCSPLQTARSNALGALGVSAINALWIDDRNFFGDDATDTINALSYGTTNVIGGAGAFQRIIDDFTDFAPAIIDKLEREVIGVPEPTTLSILSLALVGLGLSARQRRRAD